MLNASVGQPGGALPAQVSALARDEMALATAEMKRKAPKPVSGSAVLAQWWHYRGAALVAAAVLRLATVVAALLAALVIMERFWCSSA